MGSSEFFSRTTDDFRLSPDDRRTLSVLRLAGAGMTLRASLPADYLVQHPAVNRLLVACLDVFEELGFGDEPDDDDAIQVEAIR